MMSSQISGFFGRLMRPLETLSENDTERGLKLVMRDGLTSQAMGTLTTGIFLVGLLVGLGASNTMIGVVAALPFLAQLLQIPAILVVEKVGVRKLICVVASLIGRLSLLLIAASVLVPDPALALAMIVGGVLVQNAVGAFSACAWNSWMRDLVPENRLGQFFGRRLYWATITGAAISVFAGGFIDIWEGWFASQQLLVYGVLFLAGCIFGLIGVTIVSRIPEPRKTTTNGDLTLLSLVAQPFKDENFRQLIVFSASWNVAVHLAAPFFAVYMLTRLEYSMSWVIGLTVASQISNIFSLRAWGAITDKFSNKSVLAVSGPMFIFCFIGWTFSTFPEKHAFTLPLLIILHVLMGISTAGVAIALGNIALKLSPKDAATNYLAANSAVIALAGGAAPIIGGVLADMFAGQELSIALNWRSAEASLELPALNFRHWDFLFFLAFVTGLYSIHRLTLVREVGEAPEGVIVRELLAETRRSIHSLSSAAGLLRAATSFPFALLRRGANPGQSASSN